MPSDDRYGINQRAAALRRAEQERLAAEQERRAAEQKRRAAEQGRRAVEQELRSADEQNGAELLRQFVRWARRNRVPTDVRFGLRYGWKCCETEETWTDMNPGSEPSRGGSDYSHNPATVTYITRSGKLMTHSDAENFVAGPVNRRQDTTLARASEAVSRAVARTDIPWP